MWIKLVLVLVLIVLMAENWVKSDINSELEEKNEAANEEIIELQHQNHILEHENHFLKAINKGLWNNIESNKKIICYDCADNGTCREGCRFTTGAKGCLKQRRQEQ